MRHSIGVDFFVLTASYCFSIMNVQLGLSFMSNV